MQTPDGEKAIEELEAGDEVLAADAESGKPVSQKVVRTFERTTNEVVDVEIEGTIITATPEHPFWVEGEGWVGAGNLVRGLRNLGLVKEIV